MDLQKDMIVMMLSLLEGFYIKSNNSKQSLHFVVLYIQVRFVDQFLMNFLSVLVKSKAATTQVVIKSNR